MQAPEPPGSAHPKERPVSHAVRKESARIPATTRTGPRRPSVRGGCLRWSTRGSSHAQRWPDTASNRWPTTPGTT